MDAGEGVAGLEPRDETPGGDGSAGSLGPTVPQQRPPTVLWDATVDQRKALQELVELLDTVAVHMRVCDAGALAAQAEQWSERITNFLEQIGSGAVGAPE